MTNLDPTFWIWLAGAGVAALGALAGQLVAFKVLKRVTRRNSILQDLLHRARHPSRLSLVLAALLLAEAGAPVAVEIRAVLRHATALALILSLAWLFVAAAFAVQDFALMRYRVDVPDNLRARRIHTQVTVLRRLTVLAVTIITGGTMLMTFDRVRALGASILASAGVAGLVLGMAARSTLGNVLAGIQIAFTEPIRLDDVVVVEGEWGRVEEITLTYVVVRLWDQRRLVLPISYFISTPFQNWTRRTSDLLPTVELKVDYTLPVDEVRSELHRILERSELWDGRAWVLQVVDADQSSMTLRALMSARDASTAWDLRCEVREALIGWLQRAYPESLPRRRAELVNDGRPTIASRIPAVSERLVGTGIRFPWRVPSQTAPDPERDTR